MPRLNNSLMRFHTSYTENKDGCWIWNMDLNSKGYGRFSFKGKNHQAHKFAYEYYFGDIPEDRVLDHLCEVKRCVNPHHLEIVTCQENLLRARGGVLTHCKRGHELNEDTTKIYQQGEYKHRRCLKCEKLMHDKWMAKS